MRMGRQGAANLTFRRQHPILQPLNPVSFQAQFKTKSPTPTPKGVLPQLLEEAFWRISRSKPIRLRQTVWYSITYAYQTKIRDTAPHLKWLIWKYSGSKFGIQNGSHKDTGIGPIIIITRGYDALNPQPMSFAEEQLYFLNIFENWNAPQGSLVMLRLRMMNNFFENSLAVDLTLLFDETLCFW